MDSRKFSCITAAAFISSMLVIGATGLAHAQAPVVVQGRHLIDPETQRVVPYGDLNLADPTGRKTLIRRVGFAVNDICANSSGFRDFAGSAQIQECTTTAWNSAKPQISAAFERGQSAASLTTAAVTLRTDP